MCSSARRARTRGVGAASLALALLLAPTAGAGGPGPRGGAFPDLEPGGRGAALGGALAPLVDDASAVHWNPARLVDVTGRGIAVTYADLFGLQLVRHVGFFAAWPRAGQAASWDGESLTLGSSAPGSAIGVGVQSTQVELNPESYGEYDLALAYAHRGWGSLRWGAAGHLLLVRSDLADVSASGFAADLALSRPVGPRVDATLVLRSLVSSVSWKLGARESLGRSAELGVAVRPRSGVRVPAALTVDLDGGALRQAALGAEWLPAGPVLALRVGARWRDEGDRVSARAAGGLGLLWKEISFDYGLSAGPSELGPTHRFGLSLGL